MLFAEESKSETKTYKEVGDEIILTGQADHVGAGEPTADELFHLYEEIARSRPGTRDAEIFEAVREWTFSDFSRPAHEFAGVSAAELRDWQARHRINLSSGHIRPDHIDLARGHAWGTIRRDDHANGQRTKYGPPSREELLEMMGAAW